MTNQDTNDPQRVHAHLGLIRVPNNCCENWLEYTPEAARALIGDIAIAHKEALRQLAAIVEACAQGHAWADGWNHIMDGDKVTMRSCTREGCDARRIDPGWLPFEPKQHLVPYSSKLWDCTGPGCEHCADEAFGEQLRRSLADIGAVEFVGEALSGPAPSDTVITAKKIGYTWAVDATPGQVQAALDARNQFDTDPPGTIYALSNCGCGHCATSHTREGCQVVTGFAGPQCPCTTDVAKLAAKVTEIGES